MKRVFRLRNVESKTPSKHDVPGKSAQDFPPRATSAKPPRRRSPWFGALLGFGIVVLLPLLGYLGVILYVKLGYLEKNVQAGLEDFLGEGTRVGTVSTQSITGLKIDSLYVPSLDGEKPPVLEARSVQMDYSNPWSLALDQRIRSVGLEQPSLRLRRDAQGNWNFKPRVEGSSGYTIEQAWLRDGSISIEWAPRRKLELLQAQVNVVMPDEPLPFSATLDAKWPSGHAVDGYYSGGVEAGIKARLQGNLDLSRDLQSIFMEASGMAGQANYKLDFSSRPAQATLVAGEAAGTFQGTATVRDLTLPMPGGLIFARAEQRVSLDAALPAFDLKVWPTLDPLRIRLDGLGSLEGRLEPVQLEKPARHALKLSQAKIDLEIENLRTAFAPKLLGQALVLNGQASVREAVLLIPSSGAFAGFQFGGKIRADHVCVEYSGMGALPPLSLHANVTGDLESADVSQVNLKLGEVLHVSGSCALHWDKVGLDAVDVLRHLKLSQFSLNLDRFLDTDIGRRIVAQQFSLSVPAPKREDLPFDARGEILGRDLRFEARDAGGGTRFDLKGMSLRGAQVLRLPLQIPCEALSLSGEAGAEAQFMNGRVVSARMTGELRTDSEMPLVAKMALEAESVTDGKLALRKLSLDSLILPLVEVLRILGLKERYGLTGGGGLRVTQGTYDLENGKASARAEIENVTLDLRPKDLAWAVGSVKDLFATATIDFAGGKLTISGGLKSAFVRMLSFESNVQPARFVFSTDLSRPAGPREISALITWEDGQKFMTTGSLETAEGCLRLRGRAEATLAGSIPFTYEAQFNPATRDVDYVRLAADEVDLAVLQKELLANYVPSTLKLFGKVKDLRIHLNRFALMKIFQGDRAFSGSIAGNLVEGRFEEVTTNSEADTLDGTFSVNFGMDADGTRTLDASALLTRYQALIGGPVLKALYGDLVHDLIGGRLYVPTLPEHRCSLKLSLRTPKQEQGESVRLDKLEVALERLARLTLSGRVQAAGDGNLLDQGEGVLDQELVLSDLKTLHRELGVPNLRTHHPLLAAMHLEGAGTFAAKYLWGPERGAMSGELNFNKVSFNLGADRPVALKNLDGTLPLSFFRGLWPPEWPREQRGTLTLDSATWPPFAIRSQPLAIIAKPNAVELDNALVLEVPGGQLALENIRLSDFLAPEPTVHFNVNLNETLDRNGKVKKLGINVGQLAVAEAWRIVGLGETTVSGQLVNGMLVRTSGPLGSWNLRMDGELSAPLYQGILKIGGFKARGLFGAAPVWGSSVKIENMSMLQLTGQNSQLGRMKSLATITLSDFTATGFGLGDVQSFVFDFETAERTGVDDHYDGKLALLVARPMVEQAIKRNKVSEEWVAKQRFPIQRVGLRMILSGGRLTGPLPKLPGGLIIKGAGLISPDVQGQPDDSMTWSDAVRKLRTHEQRPE